MRMAGVGSVVYVMGEMKRMVLFAQTLAEVKEMWHKASNKVDSSRCQRCKTLYFYEQCTSSNTCRQCGHSVYVIENDLVSFHSISRYNRNAKHIYAKHEHFFQTLLDMTCMSRRKVSFEAVNYCKAVLGRGRHITFEMVFKTLQNGGYKRYYNLRYEISARLRGGPEIVLSTRETEKLRGHYRRYDSCFYEFQVAHRIGNRSQSGRLRLYWPVRFIMAEMFLLIDRRDLVECVKPISGRQRFLRYGEYWTRLRQFVNKRKPIAADTYRPKLTLLPFREKRQSYAEYRKAQGIMPRRVPRQVPRHCGQ